MQCNAQCTLYQTVLQCNAQCTLNQTVLQYAVRCTTLPPTGLQDYRTGQDSVLPLITDWQDPSRILDKYKDGNYRLAEEEDWQSWSGTLSRDTSKSLLVIPMLGLLMM